MDRIKREYGNIFKSLLTGILFYLAFPGNNLFLLAFVAFIPLMVIAEKESYKKIYFYSLLSGMILVCLSYSWIIYLAETFMKIPY
ncbi:MAG: hypothetical protein GY756_04805, partial [bacterium]|nr:hypothetical protein [bacterium]